MDNGYEKLANLIFPDINETIEDLEKRYPERNLPEGTEVTRFAPSPTGFLHSGALFTTLVNKKIASQTNGIFYFRLEDTDTKREIEGSADVFLNELGAFGLLPAAGRELHCHSLSHGGRMQWHIRERRGVYCNLII